MAVIKEDKIVRGGDLITVGAQIKAALAEKQDTLVSGTSIKTINNTSLLGSGDIVISDGQDGASAYELWLDAGNTGTVSDFLESLKGDTGVVIDEETFMGTIVNDLTSGGASKALSAEMGKTLGNNVSELDDNVAVQKSNLDTLEDALQIQDVLSTTTFDGAVDTLFINASKKFQTAGSSYYQVVYKSVEEETTFQVDQTIQNSAVSLGRIGYVDSISDIVAGNTPVSLKGSAATDGYYSTVVTIPAGKTMVVSSHSSAGISSIVLSVISKESYRLKSLEEQIPAIFNEFTKYPKRGCNLITESSITEGCYTSASGKYVTASGYCAIEIQFAKDSVPIYMNQIYAGYYALFDAEGNILDSGGSSAAQRLMYSGYVLPKGCVRGRFTSTKGKSTLLSSGFISYYHVLTEDEIPNRVLYDDSFSYFPPEQIPTEYLGMDMSTFRNIVCCGDSLTQGVFNQSSGSGELDTTGYDYPANLAVISGRTVTNLGYGGATTTSWFSRFSGDERLSGKDCAIIQLGVNDNSDTLETTSREAFLNIINELKERNTGIKIFLGGIINAQAYPCAHSGEAYYQKDQFIKSLYNELFVNDPQVFLIDHAKYGHLRDKKAGTYLTANDNYNSGHLSAYGYNRLAQDIYSYIGWIMHNNNSDFRLIQFIGTNYTN